MQSGFSLKDQLFNADKVAYLAGLFSAASDDFDMSGFQCRVMAKLPALELKQRISWIAQCLHEHLPAPLPRAAPVLLAALPPPLDPTRTDDDFGDFIFAPLGEYVAMRGLEEHVDLSLDLIEAITQRFSMEWAIRPFLNRWPDMVLARMRGWARHPSYHVRRLVSEGTRPRLPWGEAVNLDPGRPLALLDVLHGDATRFVTRSVANHLNDITRKDPDLVLDRLAAWRAEGAQERGEMDWITGHALRGLIKAGNPRAMKMVGFDPDAPVELRSLEVPERVAIGDVLKFSATLCAPQDTAALVDYVFWRTLANGTQSPRVFKLKQVQLPAGKPVSLGKSHRLKGDASTFRLYPGPHRIELQVNGRVLGSAGFDLVAVG